jgi:O-antigen ligase
LHLSDKSIKGHSIVAFFLLVFLPLLRIHILPFYSIRIYLILVVLVISFFVVFTGYAIRGGTVHLSISLLDMLFLCYYCCYFFSYVLSSNRDVSFIALLNEFPFILLYLFFRVSSGREGNESTIRSYATLLIVTAILLSLWGLSQYFFDFDVSGGLKNLFKTHHFPVIASLGNPNFLAEFLVLSAPLSLYLFDDGRRYIIFIVVFLIIGLTVFFTYSRLAWAVMLLFMITSIVLAPVYLRRKLITPYLLLIILASTFFIYHYKTGSTRAERIVRSVNRNGECLIAEREIMYRASISMLRDSSLCGLGPGAFAFNYLDYQGRAVKAMEGLSLKQNLIDLDHAHSDFLEIGIESGYGALIIFMILIIFSVFQGMKILFMGDDWCDYVKLIPLLYLPFGLLAFPYYSPFSKMLILLSIAHVSGTMKGYGISLRCTRFISIITMVILLSFVYFHTRYILSIIHYRRGLAFFSESSERGFGEFSEGINCFPYNGYNYFSAGALLLNQQDVSGIFYLKRSLRYMKNSYTYLYLARGYRDLGLFQKSAVWYKKLLAIRPDLINAKEEYQEIIDILDEEKITSQ